MIKYRILQKRRTIWCAPRDSIDGIDLDSINMLYKTTTRTNPIYREKEYFMILGYNEPEEHQHAPVVCCKARERKLHFHFNFPRLTRNPVSSQPRLLQSLLRQKGALVDMGPA